MAPDRVFAPVAMGPSASELERLCRYITRPSIAKGAIHFWGSFLRGRGIFTPTVDKSR